MNDQDDYNLLIELKTRLGICHATINWEWDSLTKDEIHELLIEAQLYAYISWDLTNEMILSYDKTRKPEK